MPIIDLTPTPLNSPIDTPKEFSVTPGSADVDLGSDAPGRPAWSATVAASFRQDNTIASAIASETRDSPTYQEPGFNPWDAIKGTKYEDHYKAFTDVRNTTAADDTKRQIDQELEDKKTLAASPWWQRLPSELIAGTLDLPTLIPGGAFVKTASGGVAVARSAALVGVAGGLATSIQEGFLHQSQATREASESALNIGASVLLAGALGAGGAKLLSHAEFNAGVAALNRDIANAAPVEGGGLGTSIGAAATGVPSLEANSIAGKVAGGLAQATQFNPNLRLLNSASAVVRDVASKLSEMSLYLNKNLQGVASEPAVETLMKEWNGGLVKGIKAINESWPEYRKSGGEMTHEEFREAVGRAMRRGDDDANPHVASVAKVWRAEVFEPLKDAAIKAGLLPKDVTVDTAESYFSRMWDRNKLIAQEGKAKTIFEDHFHKQMTEEFGTSVEAHTRRMARLDQEAADLSLSPEQRLAERAHIQTSLDALEKSNPELADVADRLGELRQRQIDANKTGASHPVGADAYRAQQKALIDYGGVDLKAFMEERAKLRSRKRNVESGIAAMQEKSDRVLNQIADIEDANHNTMERLVKRGQVLERNLDKLDADAFEAHVNGIIESYATVVRKADDAATKAEKQIENIKKAAEVGAEKRRTAAAKAEAEAQTGPPEQVAAKRAEAKAAAEAETAKQKARDENITRVLEREAERQRGLAERMDKIKQRLDVARDFDHDGLMDEIRRSIEKSTREISASSLARGERIAKLGERMKAFDPEKVKARIKLISELKAEAHSKFVDRWEVGRGAIDVDPASKTAQFREAAKQAADEVFNTLTGRLGSGVRPEFITIQSRGPMKDRTFHIPDRLVEEYLESDVEHVGRRYTRVMGADVEVANKYGSVDMRDQIQAVHDDYAKMRAGITDEKKLTKLALEEKADIRDIEHLRDLNRGTRQESPIERNYGNLIRSVKHINYIRTMGEVVLASLTDTIRPAMVHGLMPFLGTVTDLATNLKAVKMSVHEAQLGGNVTEMYLGHRLGTLAEITDPYAHRGPMEAFLENMTNVASKWNGIRLWTDAMKGISAVMTQNRILKAVEKYGSIKQKERDYLAFLGIDQSMAERIANLYAQHGEQHGGVRVANTEKWGTDPAGQVATRYFRAALNKDVDSIIIQKSHGDLPNFASTPTGQAILQFKSFALASHQKVLLRGLQEDQARFVGGVVAMTTMGMFQTYLKALSGNRVDKLIDPSENPGHWVSEGLDRSGILGPLMEASNAFEKISGINPIKAPMKMFDAKSTISQKNQNRNEAGAIFGPTFGLIQSAGEVLGIPKTLAAGEDVTPRQKSAATQLIPFNSYMGVRQMMNYVVNPPSQ